MLRSNALPISQQILLDLFVPPAMTLIWWLLCKSTAYQLGTDDSPAVQGWIEDGWKYLLAALYVIAISITLYAYFF
jgi:hypothetical protein